MGYLTSYGRNSAYVSRPSDRITFSLSNLWQSPSILLLVGSYLWFTNARYSSLKDCLCASLIYSTTFRPLHSTRSGPFPAVINESQYPSQYSN